MRTKQIVVILFLSLTILAATIGLASAGTALTANIFAMDSTMTMRNEFNTGETVYLGWTVAPTGSTIDITVTDPNGNIIATWTNLNPGQSGTISFQPTIAGIYYADGTGVNAPTKIAVATIFVVPEAPLGALAIAAAILAAFGITKHRQKQRH